MVYIESINIHDVKQIKEDVIKKAGRTGMYMRCITISAGNNEIVITLYSDKRENLT